MLRERGWQLWSQRLRPMFTVLRRHRLCACDSRSAKLHLLRRRGASGRHGHAGRVRFLPVGRQSRGRLWLQRPRPRCAKLRRLGLHTCYSRSVRRRLWRRRGASVRHVHKVRVRCRAVMEGEARGRRVHNRGYRRCNRRRGRRNLGRTRHSLHLEAALNRHRWQQRDVSEPIGTRRCT